MCACHVHRYIILYFELLDFLSDPHTRAAVIIRICNLPGKPLGPGAPATPGKPTSPSSPREPSLPKQSEETEILFK